jgi:hypothetical protein
VSDVLAGRVEASGRFSKLSAKEFLRLNSPLFCAGDLSNYDGSEEHPGHALLRDSDKYSEVESGLTFVGLAGLQVRRSLSEYIIKISSRQLRIPSCVLLSFSTVCAISARDYSKKH